MKKIFLVLLTALSFLWTACSSDNDEVARNYEVQVTINFPKGIKPDEVSNLVITAINKQTSADYIAEVREGVASFSLTAGEYDFRGAGKSANYNLNGLLPGVKVYREERLQLPLQIASGGTLIFKEIYFTGVKNFYFKDAFYEIYNNSAETQYLDGVILGIVDAGLPVNTYEPSPSIWVDDKGELLDRYPMTNFTVAFPGTGKEHPLEPGKSVIVAANPMNHSARELSTDDVASPVDLSTADWDIYCAPFSPVDTDYDGVPNMEVLYFTFGIDFMPSTSGQSLILAKLPKGIDNADFVADPKNMMMAPGKTGKANLMIPSKYVLDGVDVVNGVPEHRFKTLRASEDAGMTWINGDTPNSDGAYSGKSLRRKVAAVIDGRVVYQDTNNSSEDFVAGGQKPTPGVHPTAIEE